MRNRAAGTARRIRGKTSRAKNQAASALGRYDIRPQKTRVGSVRPASTKGKA